MNIVQGQAYESHFGPPSDLVDISAFVEASIQSEQWAGTQIPRPVFSTSSAALAPAATQEWQKMTPEQQIAIKSECSVEDLKSVLDEVVVDPRAMAHVSQTHEAAVHSIHETADTSNRRKKRKIIVADPAQEHPEVASIRTKLDAIQLKCWPLTLNAALFIRPPRQADHNTLITTKSLALSPAPADPHQALLFITIYSPLTWGHRLISRTSQHVVLSSQTLGNLFEAIPCTSNEMPEERNEDGRAVWRKKPGAGGSRSMVCIEGQAYGDELSGNDRSRELLAYLESIPEPKRPTLVEGVSMHETPFSSVSLSLHKPYWLFHAGNCEHFFVVEHIRLYHPSDPPLSAYPLTTQITPPLLDLCRACNKVPAVHAIVGDIRLGESPFLICGPCWRWMGLPPGDDAKKITVAPLPKHEVGWCR